MHQVTHHRGDLDTVSGQSCRGPSVRGGILVLLSMRVQYCWRMAAQSCKYRHIMRCARALRYLVEVPEGMGWTCLELFGLAVQVPVQMEHRSTSKAR